MLLHPPWLAVVAAPSPQLQIVDWSETLPRTRGSFAKKFRYMKMGRNNAATDVGVSDQY